MPSSVPFFTGPICGRGDLKGTSSFAEYGLHSSETWDQHAVKLSYCPVFATDTTMYVPTMRLFSVEKGGKLRPETEASPNVACNNTNWENHPRFGLLCRGSIWCLMKSVSLLLLATLPSLGSLSCLDEKERYKKCPSPLFVRWSC